MHGDGKETVSGAVLFLSRYEEELKRAWETTDLQKGKACWPLFNPETTTKPAPVDMRWTAPDAGWVKIINSDASFLVESGEGWAGAVARNQKGQVFFSVCRTLQRCTSVEEAEATAALVGLSELAKLYRGPLVLETDCTNLGKDLQQSASNRSACFPVIADIREALKLFSEVQVRVVGRNCNSLAHGLAKVAKTSGDQLLIAWVPSSLNQLMVNECTTTTE